MKRYLLSVLILLGATISSAQKVGPWDLDELYTVPEFEYTDLVPEDGVSSILYRSLDYLGDTVKVYAYYSAPEGDVPEGGWPGVVFAHGGGGTAIASWVTWWNERGYAAIAMDLEGHIPMRDDDGKFIPTSHPGPSRWGVFHDYELPIEEQWYYHAVAHVIYAHTLIASFPEVNASKIGIIGASWGGTITSTVMGVDNRWAWATPVYGAGYLWDADGNQGRSLAQDADRTAFLAEHYDGSAYFDRVDFPTMWVNGTNDNSFGITCNQRSSRAVNGPATLVYPLRFGHGQTAAKSLIQTQIFADQVIHGADPLMVLGKPEQVDNKVVASYSSVVDVERAELFYTYDVDSIWSSKYWYNVPAVVEEDQLSAEIPQGTFAVILVGYDTRDAFVSTEFLILEQDSVNNLALSGIASQSTTDGNAIADRAIDGNTNGIFNEKSVTSTTYESNPWWEVDWGTSNSIDEIVIYNRTDCCTDRLSDYTVSVLDGDRNTVFSQTFSSYPDPSIKVDAGDVSGQIVRISLNGTDYLSLAEVQVIETPIAVSGISIKPSNTSIVIGTQQGLTPVFTPATATDRRIVWTSSDPTIASVNSYGVVSAMELGVATITATTVDGAYIDKSIVNVVEPPKNIAVYGTATQSSGYSTTKGLADLAIDGNTAGGFNEGSVTHTDTEENPWWQVDLGSDTIIGDINIFGRTDDCCASRLSDYTVYVIDSEGNVNYYENLNTYPNVSINAGNVVGQIVKIVLNDTNPLSLAEVEVYAGIAQEPGVETIINGERNADGSIKKWHRIELLFKGPELSEASATFRNYRLDVTFTSPSGVEYVVPGFFDADGDPANTSATSGDVWKARFTAGEEGTWIYDVSFVTGDNVAAQLSGGTGGIAPDGEFGSFIVGAQDKTGRDFRSKGKLEYVGEHYLQFADGDYFVKAGANSPEIFLEYGEFDNTPNSASNLYSSVIDQWNDGDPTWGNEKGKGIIGAVNYLADAGVNSHYFLVMNAYGDGGDTWPWTDQDSKDIYDVSKLAQWETVFSHFDTKGLMLHLVTAESENSNYFEFDDGTTFSDTRKIFYRELIARFGHHLAITWNTGEENQAGTDGIELANTDEQRKQFADWIRELAPYKDNISVHNGPAEVTQDIFPALLGHTSFTSPSLQTKMFNNSRTHVREWWDESENAGHKWIVCNDEPWGRTTTTEDVTTFRQDVIWASYTAGAAGVEWYGGSGDVTHLDYTGVSGIWNALGIAADFMNTNLSQDIHKMKPNDDLINGDDNWALAEEGANYLFYLKAGGEAIVDLSGALEQKYSVHWFNPSNGGNLIVGALDSVTGGVTGVSLGTPPNSTDQDWVVLLRKGDGNSIDPGDINLALYGTASQSSTDYDGDANLAIDGNTNGVYNNNSVTHTTVEDNPWWQVDLGQNFNIGDINIFGRTDACCAGRLSDYTVYVIDSDGNITYSENLSTYPETSINANGAVGQIVKIVLNGTNALSLAEVQVFAGEPAEQVTQTIELKEGWNLVSLYINPNNSLTGTVFSNATIVKTFDAFYSSSQADFLNTLTTIEAGVGYLVYNSIDETITISGVLETHGRASLQDGWNLIGVPSSTSLPLSTYPDATIIKEFDSFYEEGNDLNSLSELKPGKAYFIKK